MKSFSPAWLFVFLALLTPCAYADVTGRVVAVLDGDTIIVLDESRVEHRIRFTGIDAPEKKQAFGAVSKQHLSDLVYNKMVTVVVEKTDKYGRELGKVLIPRDKDVNLEQVRAGLAWHYKQYAHTQSEIDQQFYAAAENEARAAKRGLWADAQPTAPWDWRHAK